jgi:diguanylate cyclase (GGDEF)-like protein
MMRTFSIEAKIVITIVLFTIFIVGLERYQLSENIVEQFVESKTSKQTLLKETIAPVLALNISLGLHEANKEYLDQIVKQNADLEAVELLSLNQDNLYSYSKSPQQKFKKDDNNGINFCSKELLDPLTQEPLGYIYFHFYDNEYQAVLQKNAETTVKISIITFISLSILVILIRRAFTDLKELSKKVLSYDPNKADEFILLPSKRTDEVGIIHNAIMSMVEKINSHSKLLDDLNDSLEKKVHERTKELESANRKLSELSMTDSLTGLANRRDFEKNLSEIWDVSKRKSAYISLIICDIDHFKDVNDTYGHQAGDVVLKNVADVLKSSLKRSTDFVARYGGEEFVIVLFDTGDKGAHELCITIQEKLQNMDHFIDQTLSIEPITLSFGINSLIPTTENSSDNLFRLADKALYEAKANGRDCIVHNVDGTMSMIRTEK